jgi:hypothetical protein
VVSLLDGCADSSTSAGNSSVACERGATLSILIQLNLATNYTDFPFTKYIDVTFHFLAHFPSLRIPISLRTPPWVEGGERSRRHLADDAQCI